MAASAIPSCKAELFGLLKADEQLADVEVQYGRKANPQNEYVCLLEATDWEREFANLSVNPQIDETFTIKALVGAYKPGQDQQEATERSFEIFDHVDRIVRAHIQYARDDADSPVLWMATRVTDHFEYPYLEGQVSVIECGVFFQTRI